MNTPPFLLAARIRGGEPLAVGVVLYCIVLIVAPKSLVPVPGRDGVTGLIWPAAPILLTLPLYSFRKLWSRPLELTSSRPLAPAAAVLAAAATTVALVLSQIVQEPEGQVLTRNFLLLFGISATSTLLPEGISWLPPVATITTMWLLGTRANGLAEPWALLFLPAGIPRANQISTAIFVVGITVFIVRAALANTVYRWHPTR